jgi:hypothetical protein
LKDAKYVQPQNNGCPVDKLHNNVILRKILQAVLRMISFGRNESSRDYSRMMPDKNLKIQ